MKQHIFAAFVVCAAASGCVPAMQVAQNPVQRGVFTVRLGTGMDTQCMIASSAERPLFVRSLVIKGWTTPSDICPDLDGDGFCEITKEVQKEFFVSAGRERYFGDCAFFAEAKGWDFEVFYEEAEVGAETVPFTRDASATRPPPASIPPRSTPRSSSEPAPVTPPPAPTSTVPPEAPAPP